MKKLYILLFLMFAFTLFASQALAGSDKVRGEIGAGSTTQECVSFEGCPYGQITPTP